MKISDDNHAGNPMQKKLYPLLADVLKRQQRICLNPNQILPEKYRKLHSPTDGEIYSLQDIYCVNPRSLKHAAILAPLFVKNGAYHLLLTRRAEKLEHHKGEISFPGGAKDLRDSSLLDTALRETEEEIGLPASKVKILGMLDDVFTVVSRFIVTPYVGVIPYPYQFSVNHAEIQEIIEVPLVFFLQESNYWEDSSCHCGRKFRSYFFQWRQDIVIWGVTGFIIKNLCQVLRENLPANWQLI